MNINTEEVSALSSAYQLNNCLVEYSTLEYFINDEASDDRAIKCCISNHYHHNCRRRIVVEATATNNQSKYVSSTLNHCKQLCTFTWSSYTVL